MPGLWVNLQRNPQDLASSGCQGTYLETRLLDDKCPKSGLPPVEALNEGQAERCATAGVSVVG